MYGQKTAAAEEIRGISAFKEDWDKFVYSMRFLTFWWDGQRVLRVTGIRFFSVQGVTPST